MLAELLSVYLQGLLLAAIVVLMLLISWGVFRMVKKLDKTAKERQAFLYDSIIIATMVIPILSFAFTGIILMIKA